MAVLICLIFSVLSTIDQYVDFANETLFWMVNTTLLYYRYNPVQYMFLFYGQLLVSLRPYCPALVLRSGFANCMYFLRLNRRMNETEAEFGFSIWGAMASAVTRVYNGGLGLCPSGVQGQSPWSGALGAKPPEAEHIY